MTTWKKGDIAICVNVRTLRNYGNGTPPPLIKDREYVVNSIHICGCGKLALDVGIAHTMDEHSCNKCDRITINEPIWWCAAERFVKKQTLSLKEQISEAISTENYELAHSLQDELQKQNKVHA